MRFALSHLTLYEYDRLVGLGPQTLRLRPMSHCPSPILFHSITIEPSNHAVQWLNDALDNPIGVVTFQQKIRRLSFSVDCVIDIHPNSRYFIEPLGSQHFFGSQSLSSFVTAAQPSALVQAFADTYCPLGSNALESAQILNQALHQQIQYKVRLEAGVQSTEQTLNLQSGSCRDSAWLLVQLLRQRGWTARFVSGYLIDWQAFPESSSTPLSDSELQTPSGHQLTELHAWCEVWTPELAWVGLDPTSGLFTGGGHIPLAAGIEPEHVAPITGWLEPCEVKFSHSMQLRMIQMNA